MKKTLFILVVCWIGGLCAAKAAPRAGAAFLTMGVGARAAGLGSAYTALADDASALYWNPAGLNRVNRREILVSHALGLSDVRQNFLGYVQPTRHGSFGVGGVFLTQGELEGRSATREKTGSFGATDAAAVISVGRRISPLLQTGASLKMIQETIGNEQAQGYAVDLGLSITPLRGGVQGGVVLRHLGPHLSFGGETFALPTTLTAGVSSGLASLGRVSMDTDWNLVDHRVSLKGGVEWSPAAIFSLRGGYAFPLASSVSSAKSLSGFVWGLGVNPGAFRLDYAVSPGSDLGNEQHISLGMGF